MTRTAACAGAFVIATGIGCSSDRETPPAGPSGSGATVRIEYRAPTARRGDLLGSFEACVLGVGQTHAHVSWQNFDARVLTPAPPDRFETTYTDAPIDTSVSFRVNDGNNCDQNPTGAATRNVFVNGVQLTQNTLTPGSGLEPGFAFMISAAGRVTQ